MFEGMCDVSFGDGTSRNSLGISQIAFEPGLPPTKRSATPPPKKVCQLAPLLKWPPASVWPYLARANDMGGGSRVAPAAGIPGGGADDALQQPPPRQPSGAPGPSCAPDVRPVGDLPATPAHGFIGCAATHLFGLHPPPLPLRGTGCHEGPWPRPSRRPVAGTP